VTTEQTIVLGVLAAAFVAGWGVRALIGRADRRAARQEHEAAEEHLDPSLQQSRRALEQAIVDFVTRLTASSDAGTRARRRGALVDEVSAALADDVANESMIDGVNGNGLTERELDLADWGFAYGVAWARLRERRPTDPAEAVARDARRAAESVFREYAADASWTPPPVAAEDEGEPGDRLKSGD
jgi:hypothetical protein